MQSLDICIGQQILCFNHHDLPYLDICIGQQILCWQCWVSGFLVNLLPKCLISFISP